MKATPKANIRACMQSKQFLQVFLSKYRVVTYLVDACPFASVSMQVGCPKILILIN